MTSDTRRPIAALLPAWIIYAFTLGLLYQGFHYVEHLVQLYQHAVLDISPLHAHGALFFLDLEWNHFVFNIIYFIALAVLCFYVIRIARASGSLLTLMPILLMIGTAVAGWHAIEHTARIFQHIASGCEPCLGIGGYYFDIIYLHSVYNTQVFLIPLATYFLGGFHKRFWRLL